MKTTTLTKNDFAKALSWNPKNVAGRLGALGLLDVCGRCGGSGRYSFNQMDGDMCFGCRRIGKTLPKLTAELVVTVQARVAAGDLDAYLAACQAKAAAKAAIAPLVARADELAAPIDKAYDVAYRAQTIVCDVGVSAARGLVIALLDGRTYLGMPPTCNEHMAISEIQSAVRYGKIDYLVAVRMIADRVAMLEELSAAWIASVATEAT